MAKFAGFKFAFSLSLAMTLPQMAWAEYSDKLPSCKVIKVSDGDSLTCLKDKKSFKIRLDQIDAPEYGQPFNNKARSFLNKLVYNQTVKYQSHGKDHYGRTLATIYYHQTNVNKLLVSNGLAWAYRKYLRDHDYIKLEQRSKSQKLNIWSENNPTPPYIHRQRKNKKTMP